MALGLIVVCLLIGATLRLPALTQFPPGLHYDQAANVTLAGDIGLRGQHPIFISSYTGKEVLYFYLAGGLTQLLGESAWTTRLTTAFVGIVTLAVTYAMGRAMGMKRAEMVLAIALLAVSFWHLSFSRYGFRAITQPLLQGLTVAALFVAIRQQKVGFFVVAGIFLGLTAYTYLAARLFPILLLIALLPLWRHWKKLILLLGVAATVLLPLLYYFYLYPDSFWVRIGQVAPEQASLGLVESYLKSLGMIFVQGDPYIRFNLPGRPIFHWFWGLLAVVGWGHIFIHAWRAKEDWQRASNWLLFFAPLVMVLPTALAVSEIVPSNIRAIGLLPFLYLLPAHGLSILLHQFSFRLFFPAAILLTLLLGGLESYQAYFREWGTRADLFYESEGDLVAVANYLDSLEPNDRLFVAALHYRHPTIAALSQQYSRVSWLVEGQAVVVPAQGAATYIFPHQIGVPVYAQPLFVNADRTEGAVGPDGQPLFVAYHSSQPIQPEIAHPLGLNFGYAVQLLGYDVGTTTANDSLPLTLFWKVIGQPAVSYSSFVHLEDEWGFRWGQAESNPYPTEQWQLGELVVQQILVTVPAGTPPGSYRVKLGWFDPVTTNRLPIVEGGGTAYTITDVRIDPAPVLPDPLPTPPVVLNISHPSGLQLLGMEWGKSVLEAGESLNFGLWWLAKEKVPALPLSFQLQPVSGSQPTILLAQTQPIHGNYPFADWATPQLIIDRQTLAIPLDIPPAQYHLNLQLGNEMVSLGDLTIQPSSRLFQPPAIAHPLNLHFAGEISLLGYNWQANRLQLIWQAEQPPSQNYTAFVHLLEADGRCCLWQADRFPGNGATMDWLTGQVVVDEYELPALSALTQVEIGLYWAENGQRLPILQADGNQQDQFLLTLQP